MKLTHITNITVSGRIGTGTTTLAKGLQKHLGWKLLEGGKLFEDFHKSIKTSESEVETRPDKIDTDYEEMIKKILQNEKHNIVQSHLAGFDAQQIPNVFKIGVICENKKGEDMLEERAKRLQARKNISRQDAIEEVQKRENGNLEKWRRLYANNNSDWVYWDKKYYDIVINTFTLNAREALAQTLQSLSAANKR